MLGAIRGQLRFPFFFLSRRSCLCFSYLQSTHTRWPVRVGTSHPSGEGLAGSNKALGLSYSDSISSSSASSNLSSKPSASARRRRKCASKANYPVAWDRDTSKTDGLLSHYGHYTLLRTVLEAKGALRGTANRLRPPATADGPHGLRSPTSSTDGRPAQAHAQHAAHSAQRTITTYNIQLQRTITTNNIQRTAYNYNVQHRTYNAQGTGHRRSVCTDRSARACTR